MHKTDVVFFEHIRLFGDKLGVMLAIWAMLPFPCLVCAMIPTPFTVVIGVIGLILWIPLGIWIILHTKKEVKTFYRLLPECPAKHRFDQSVSFDFETVPGKVRCQITSPEETSKFHDVQKIEYDDVTKIFKFVVQSDILIVPGGAHGVYPTIRYYTGVVAAPDSEELMRLLRKHNIKFKPFDTEMASYVVEALKKKQ